MKKIISVFITMLMVFTILLIPTNKSTVFAECDCFNGFDNEEIIIPATLQSDGQSYYACVKCGIPDSDIEVISRIETITLNKTEYVCDGKVKKPSVEIISADGTELESGTDYKLEYKNNKNVGKATVTITFKGKYSGTVDKHFYIIKGKLTLNHKKLNLKLTEKKKLKASKNPKKGFNAKIHWKSSNSKVASVSSSGMVKPTGFGKCTITAYTKAGAQAKCKVFVKESDLYLFKNHTFTLAKINGKTQKWKSKNPSIAKGGKKALGISQGKTTLYKKINGTTYKYNIYITDYKKLAEAAINKAGDGEMGFMGYYVKYDDFSGAQNPIALQKPTVCIIYTSWSLLFGYDNDYEYFAYDKNFKAKSICSEDELNECDHSIRCYQYSNFGNRKHKQNWE